MSKKILLVLFCGSVALLPAGLTAASVSNVAWSQDADSRVVTVDYTLSGAPAVVTFDFLTNGVSIGGENLTGGNEPKPQPQGDVFRLVESNGPHAFTWRPDRTWSDHVATGQLVVKAWATDDPPDYMSLMVEPNSGDPVTFYPAVEWLPGGVLSNPVYRTGAILMRRIHAANVPWNMGTFAAVGSKSLENIMNPVIEKMHRVTLTNDYYIAVFEFTRGQGDRVGGFGASGGLFDLSTAMRPADNDFGYHSIREATNGAPIGAKAQAIPQYQYPNPPSPDGTLGRLRTRFGLAFDFPSEAQWEFAARAGHGDGYWPDGSPYAWFNATTQTYGKVDATYWLQDANLKARYRYDCATPETPAGASYVTAGTTNGTNIVGSYPPNDFGLYDMLGNISEWCLDWYAKDISSLNGAVNANGSYLADGVTVGQKRVFRGGCYTSYAYCCLPQHRQEGGTGTFFSDANTAKSPYGRGFTVGLRLCCPADVSGLVR